MPKYKMRGISFEKNGRRALLQIYPLNDIDISLSIAGPWEKNTNGNLIEHWVDYTSVTVNGQEILSQTTPVWHNTPFKHVIHAQKGKEIIVNAKWKKHKK